jgi:hypothetical protein
MNRENGSAENNVKTKLVRRRPGWGSAILGVLLLLIGLAFLLRDCSKKTAVPEVTSDSSATIPENTAGGTIEDTVMIPGQNVQKDTIVDTVSSLPIKKPVARPIVPNVDTVQVDTTVVAAGDSISNAAVSAGTDRRSDTITVDDGLCREDTAELWVYPDPSGGLHYSSVRISFVANRPATIHYRTGNDTVWHRYDGSAIVVDTSTTLYYDAIDSCGNVMERRSEYYEFDKKRSMSPCRPDMEQIKVGTMNFCIDRYEWPNRKGRKPQSFISLYQAMDSCFSVQKRLCASEEWAMACSGPYSSKYPYGQQYERYGCSTHDTVVRVSGSKAECRSFFGVFDMSGNLLEWTTTKSVENSAFYYVMGGFWESGPKSGCFDKRYSYYPQNQHNPVGFRCCRDLVSSPAQPSAIGK